MIPSSGRSLEKEIVTHSNISTPSAPFYVPINYFFIVSFSVVIYVLWLVLCVFKNHLIVGKIRVCNDVHITIPGICDYVMLMARGVLRL